MLSFFRRVSKSKIGTGVMAVVLLGILAGFALADLTNFGSGSISFGMSSGTLASVGDQTVSERDINRALDGLPPAQRSVVSAISVDGHSIGDTASKLGISETAVRVSLHRGLAAIAKRFGRQ